MTNTVMLKGQSLDINPFNAIYWTVKHITVIEKTQHGKIQVLPFFFFFFISADIKNTVSMLHSLHQGPDWWGKKKTKIPLMYKMQRWGSVTYSDGDTVITNFASRNDTLPLVDTVSNKNDTTQLTEPVEQQGKTLHADQTSNLTVANSIKRHYIQDFIKGYDCVLMMACDVAEKDEVRTSVPYRDWHIFKSHNVCFYFMY